MKNLWLVTTIFLAVLSNIPNAAAFSVDQSANQNSDGSPKFADPDEQKPGFMVTPSNTVTGNGALSFSSSSESMPIQSDHDNGERAFDRAFSHQEDKE